MIKRCSIGLLSLGLLLSQMGCGNSQPTLPTDAATVEKLEELAKQGTPGEKKR